MNFDLKKITLPFLLIIFFSCGTKKDLRVDLHSFSKPHYVATTHLDLDINIDFQKKIISGIATYAIENKVGSKHLVLDTDGLFIHKVTSGEKELNFHLGSNDSILGQALIIEIEKDLKEVSIHYKSHRVSKALQWLSPEQTAGKKHPFLFTQSQAILARSWIPCQDSPGVRFTYTAKVRVPVDLLPVMSAENPITKNETGVYFFEMEQAIPAYLMALGVGDLSFQTIGSRTGVYAEAELIQKAAYEFAETESMLEIAEDMYGAYKWDRFDLLVLGCMTLRMKR